MKVLVFSDTHGYCYHMVRVIEEEAPSCVIHLGDCTNDAEELHRHFPMLPVLSVRGNCDYGDHITQDSAISDFDGIRVLSSHGHKYGVKGSLLRFLMAAKENAVHVALFGHTHCAYCENVDGIWLMNPGSCGYTTRATYGVLEITDHAAACIIKTVKENIT